MRLRAGLRLAEPSGAGVSLTAAIAAAIPDPMLSLRTRLLVRDVTARFHCSVRTAMDAVTVARVSRGLSRRAP